MSRPVSANITTPTPSTPKAASRDWASSRFTASCEPRVKDVAIGASPFVRGRAGHGVARRRTIVQTVY